MGCQGSVPDVPTQAIAPKRNADRLLSSAVFLCAAIVLCAGALAAQSGRGSIAGRVQRMDGTAASGVRVFAMQVESNTSGAGAAPNPSMYVFTLTDNGGRYRLDDLPAGRYYVAAGAVGSPTYYPGSASMQLATVVEVKSGQAVEGRDFVAAPRSIGVRVSGRVVLSGAAPRTARLTGQDNSMEAPVGPDGSFEFPRVLPGRYELTSPFGLGVSSMSIVVGNEDVALSMPSQLRVAGQVLVEGGAPPSFALTVIQGAQKFRVPVQPEPDGQFSVSLPDGESRVAIADLSEGFYPKSFTLGSTDVIRNVIKVERTDNSSASAATLRVSLGLTATAPRFKVSGRVVSVANSIFNLVVLIETLTGRLSTTKATDDGIFAFPSVLPGVYTISTVRSISFTGTAIVSGTAESAIVPVVVSDKEVADIEVPDYFAVNGRASVADGSALPRFSFRVSGANGFSFRPSSVSVSPVFSSPGEFSVRLPRTSTFLEVVGLPSTYTVKRFSCGTTDLAEYRFDPTTADSCEIELVFSLRHDSQIAGRR